VYGENRSADSEPVSRWAGPDAPTITQLEPSIALAAAYEIRWQNAETATEDWVTQILDRNVTQGDPTFALVSSLPYPMQGPEVVQHSGHGGEDYEVQIRHAVTAFGVTDFSQVSGPSTVTLSPPCAGRSRSSAPGRADSSCRRSPAGATLILRERNAAALECVWRRWRAPAPGRYRADRRRQRDRRPDPATPACGRIRS